MDNTVHSSYLQGFVCIMSQVVKALVAQHACKEPHFYDCMLPCCSLNRLDSICERIFAHGSNLGRMTQNDRLDLG